MSQAGHDASLWAYKQWPTDASLHLLTLLYDGVNRGWRNANGTIGKQTIEERILPRLTELCNGKVYTYAQYASRWKWYKTQYRKYMVLQKFSSGFGWDERTGLFQASEEVWQSFFRSHPDCRNLRNEKIDGWPMIVVIAGEVIAEGNNMAGVNAEGNDITPSADMEDETQPPDDDTQVGDSDEEFNASLGIGDGDGQPPCPPIQPIPPIPTMSTPSASTSSRKRRREDDSGSISTPTPYEEEVAGLVKEIGEINCTFRDVSKVMQANKDLMAWRLADPWDALCETEWIDDDTRFRMMRLLKDRNERRSFIRMNQDARRRWCAIVCAENEPPYVPRREEDDL